MESMAQKLEDNPTSFNHQAALSVKLQRNHFLKALSHAQGVVEKRTTVPILSHILLEAFDSQVNLTATDLEVAIIETIQAEVSVPGRLAIPAQMMFDIVRKLKDESDIFLNVDANSGRIKLTSGKSEFKIPFLSADDFPVINSGKQPFKFSLPASTIKDFMDKTRFAMSMEETRYFLNGIYLHAYQGHELRVVATDGHRLAKVSSAMPKGAENIPGVIVSRKTVNEVLKLAHDAVIDVEILLSETQISFKFSDVFLTARLIDGNFPDYEKVIPQKNDKVILVDMDSFSESIDRVSTISAEKNRGVKLSIHPSKMIISATSSDAGSANEEIEIEYEGVSFDIGFNSKYLLDIAQQIGSDNAEFHCSDSSAPVMVKGQHDDECLYVLMPMRV